MLAPEPAVLLPNGKVLVAGLYGGSGVYDPVADSWTTGATMTFDVIQIEPGGGLLTLLPNGKVLAAGGESNFAELYTPAGPPIAGAVTTTVAFDSSNDTITPNLSGGTTFIVSVATQPAHGKAAASGTSLTYTPNAGYAGPDSFTYVAENGDGSSLPATVSLTVSAPTIGLGTDDDPRSASRSALQHERDGRGRNRAVSFLGLGRRRAGRARAEWLDRCDFGNADGWRKCILQGDGDRQQRRQRSV